MPSQPSGWSPTPGLPQLALRAQISSYQVLPRRVSSGGNRSGFFLSLHGDDQALAETEQSLSSRQVRDARTQADQAV
jgi:hypothetical protein